MGTSTLPSPYSPNSSPTHSPPRQRLGRTTESYSEESEEDPKEESDPEEELDPDEEPEEEPLPAELTPDAQIQGVGMDVDVPQVESPDYTPTTPPFVVPPSPVALQPVSPHTEDEDLTDGERIILQLEMHESVLDDHTDRLERLQGQEQRVETAHRAAGVLLENVDLIR
ncbi:hypothetical protein CTI12_AA111630 [Artemisia annua]|uniref:Uncharacterized protein n=1 Tax=Artemisia annua TaxID=35608 RepID=A0A2U1PUJ7_ARTAN|nr:hypothetical protein CTI12_AA111630 [Artemisia annua]